MYSVKTDKKWQQRWQADQLDSFDAERADRKFYCLEMFAYPSGENLHVGHWYNFAPADTYGRFKKMQGYEVFHPMGFDAFGLPAENYAIKTGAHPRDSTLKNVEIMRRQLREIGAAYDWNYELVTCLPEYYRWTQLLFLKLFHSGQAYRKAAPVNWCPKCQTVLANEQTIDNHCERCDSEVVRKNMTQWFFKITDYAEQLLDGLHGLDWPESTKKAQTNWIGKSSGNEVVFAIENRKESIRVFTTRVDTLFGVSYLVLAPEHELVNAITTSEWQVAVRSYVEQAAHKSEIERQYSDAEKTGVPTGAYALHPLTGKALPIWVSDYVIGSYGTGAVMAVPAHDERDFSFADKYGLPVKQVVTSISASTAELPFTEKGRLINCGEYDGLSSEQAAEKITARLNKIEKGTQKTVYKLRDWLVSRQRYWGTPIPVVHCQECGIVPLSENDLPLLLPYDVQFAPTGESPLKRHEEFMNTSCPKCGHPALRDPDTLDTFVCSSWYYLRYPDNKNTDKPFDSDWINKMLPVDKYVGGRDHATMHLLYARYITKFLRDQGWIDFDEPFKSLVHQGMILGSDGEKMSKSKQNGVSPDVYIKKYGSDAFRMFLMFAFSYSDGGPWSDNGINAIAKFLTRVEKMIDEVKSQPAGKSIAATEAERELRYVTATAIKKITGDIERFSFNTAIAKLMEWLNALNQYRQDKPTNAQLIRENAIQFITVLAPFAPHFAEEMNERLGQKKSIHVNSWPVWNDSDLRREKVEIAVQVNGVVRLRLDVPCEIETDVIRQLVLEDNQVLKVLDGRAAKKVIVVPGRLVNIVV